MRAASLSLSDLWVGLRVMIALSSQQRLPGVGFGRLLEEERSLETEVQVPKEPGVLGPSFYFCI